MIGRHELHDAREEIVRLTRQVRRAKRLMRALVKRVAAPGSPIEEVALPELVAIDVFLKHGR